MSGLSRRRLLIGGGGAALVAAAAAGGGYELIQNGTLPGKYQLDRLLGACGSDPGEPTGPAGVIVPGSFWSRYRRRDVEMIVMRPPGPVGALPVALVLHGAGGDAASATSLGYPRYLNAAAHAGVPPFAAVAVDGGAATYWHRRADGDDAAGMLIYEVLPRLERQGYHVDRIGVAGWSMGGYGALLLASRLGPGRVAAVAASSPAVFASYSDAIAADPASFDSPADFTANDVRSPARLATIRRVPCRIDCGSTDPFNAMVTALRKDLGNPPGAISAGCHDQAFWRRSLPAQLAFIGRHLA